MWCLSIAWTGAKVSLDSFSVFVHDNSPDDKVFETFVVTRPHAATGRVSPGHVLKWYTKSRLEWTNFLRKLVCVWIS